MARVFDETKTKELFVYDIEKGHLVPDKLFVAHHPEVFRQEGTFHYKTINTYPNGGAVVEKVWDTLPVEPRTAYDEYEDILVYIPFTQAELEVQKNRKYEGLVEMFIRERYSLNAEIALIRQQTEKPDEYKEYYDFAESCKARAKEQLGL